MSMQNESEERAAASRIAIACQNCRKKKVWDTTP